MQPLRLPVASAAALALLLSLTACGGGGSPGASASSDASSSSASAPSGAASSSAAGGATAADVCALVPRAPLEAAIGADPGEGKASKGKIGGGQCTWKVSDTHTALAQYTPEPDAYLPDGVFTRPTSGADVPGADRGFAAAETHTILVVKDGHGLLFTDVGFAKADQDAYDALAKAIVARM